MRRLYKHIFVLSAFDNDVLRKISESKRDKVTEK